MEKFLITTIATGLLLIGSACTTGANNNVATYEDSAVKTTGNFNKATHSSDPRCSTYPKTAEYKRRNQRLGLDKICN